jgi:ElaB/YqjD/DUF883 family membrane-anchored ribosome-binding protein
MTPGHVVDQLVDYANDSSAGAFFRNLREQAVANPMPIALMGAGMAWLAFSSRRTNPSSATGRTSTSVVRGASDASEKLGERGDDVQSAASDVGERARDTASGLQESADKATARAAGTATSTYEAAAERAGEAGARLRQGAKSVADATSATYEAAAQQAHRASGKVQSAASQVRDNVASGSRSVMNFLNEQPLVTVGIGLALGALIGAALPSTDAEDELMGEGSDAVKRETAALAEDGLEKGKAVAKEAWEGAMDEAEKQGMVGKAETGSTFPLTDDAELANQHVENGQASLVPTSETTVDREFERRGS